MALKCKSFAWGGIYILSSRSYFVCFGGIHVGASIQYHLEWKPSKIIRFHSPQYITPNIGCSGAVSPKAIQSPCRRNKRDLDVKAMRKVCCTCALCIFPYYVFISSVFIILRVKQLQYSILRYARTNAVYVEEVGGVSGETETLNMVSRVNTILFLSQVFSEKCIWEYIC